MAGSHRAAFAVPKFPKAYGARHSAPGTAARPKRDADVSATHGQRGYEPRHATRQRHNPQHDAPRRGEPVQRGRHRDDGSGRDAVWYPTLSEWERLDRGETVRGVRLTDANPGHRGAHRRGRR